MKKIYSNSNGRRRAFWERDCQVEFWRNKCNSKVNEEKIEQLQNILDLLKNGNKSLGEKNIKNDDILSRVYLADASVFPRKEPLSLIGESSSIEKNNGTKVENCDKSRVVSVKKENKNKKEDKILSGEIRSDKRKWALEVLARKNASTLEINKEKNEDCSSLKNKYPLLAQLPIDMKPVLAASQHNKIPLAVRQTQLYRVAEHFLRRTNVPIIRRLAETELAVADAINIEKEICDKSNSKIVYLNLISRYLLQNKEKSKTECEEINENGIRSEQNEILENGTNYRNDGNTPDKEKTERGEIKENDIKSEQNEILENGKNGVEELLRLAGLENSLDRYDENTPDKEKTELEEIKEKGITSEQNEILGNGMNDVEELLRLAGLENSPDRNNENTLLEREEINDENALLDREKRDDIEKTLKMAGFSSDNISENRTEKKKPILERQKDDLIKPSGSEASKNSIIHKNNNNGNIINNKKEEQNEECGSETESCAESKSISKNKLLKPVNKKLSDSAISISKKVEVYVKEHLRPLCKSGVINVGQYRWAVAKTTEKVMRFHHKDKNANFLIKEGEKVKKLAEQYVETAQQ